jgi:transposase
MEDKDFETKIIKAHIPKTCVCPQCKKEQSFKKHKEYWKRVKDLSLDKPTILLVQQISAKCSNRACERRSFILPTSGIERYQRATLRVKEEAINKSVLDNVSYPRISRSLVRSFNITGSKSTIDRWKQREASQYSFKEIIPKLDFSGVLSVDEYKPRRAKSYDLIAADARRRRLLYLENISDSPKHAGSIGRGHIENFFRHLKELGIEPFAVIFDLMKAFPNQVKKVWPEVLIQYDHFHVMQLIHSHLKQELFGFHRKLKEAGLEDERAEIWQHKWSILKNMDQWSPKEHQLISQLIQVYSGTPVELVLIFKEHLYQIFDLSNTPDEAYAKRDALFVEQWWRSSPDLNQIMKFLMSPDFQHMITYLGHKSIPRSGNLETLIRSWRLMEKVRYGFKTEKGRQNHLKLYQIKHYLNNFSAENSGQLHIP